MAKIILIKNKDGVLISRLTINYNNQSCYYIMNKHIDKTITIKYAHTKKEPKPLPHITDKYLLESDQRPKQNSKKKPQNF